MVVSHYDTIYICEDSKTKVSSQNTVQITKSGSFLFWCCPWILLWLIYLKFCVFHSHKTSDGKPLRESKWLLVLMSYCKTIYVFGDSKTRLSSRNSIQNPGSGSSLVWWCTCFLLWLTSFKFFFSQIFGWYTFNRIKITPRCNVLLQHHLRFWKLRDQGELLKWLSEPKFRVFFGLVMSLFFVVIKFF